MEEPSLTRARSGAVLALVGALLLANPLYVGLLVDEPRSRSPTGYVGVPVDPANASDQATVIQRVGGDDVLALDELASANEYSPYGDRYRAPAGAADVLRRARTDGSASTDDAEVAFTLRRVLASHRYVAVDDGEVPRYYRATVEESEASVAVTLTSVDRSTVARYVLQRDARLYSALPGYQRETVDAVLAHEGAGYRPYNDEFADLTDDVVVKDGTYYVFRAGVHADDFGPTGREVASLVLSALGALAFLIASVLTGLSFLGGDGDDAGEGDDGGDERTRHRRG